MQEALAELERRRDAARAGGGPKRVAAQHAKGRLTARERLDILLDPGSFEELDMYVEHNATEFGMPSKSSPATVSSPAAARSAGGWCLSSARTSPSSAAP